MVHTTFTGSRQEAQETYEAMKKEIGRFLEELAAIPKKGELCLSFFADQPGKKEGLLFDAY
jgi:hypothetical protein